LISTLQVHPVINGAVEVIWWSTKPPASHSRFGIKQIIRASAIRILRYAERETAKHGPPPDMKTKSSVLLLASFICLVAPWVLRPVAIAQSPSGNPTVPKPAADPASPAGGELRSPDLANPADNELRALILLLTERIKPAANAMPNRLKNDFIEDEKLILMLASEVLRLRERVEKLERNSKAPDAPK
jgi:hypothetical protein